MDILWSPAICIWPTFLRENILNLNWDTFALSMGVFFHEWNLVLTMWEEGGK